jgi:hypothetical protein
MSSPLFRMVLSLALAGCMLSPVAGAGILRPKTPAQRAIGFMASPPGSVIHPQKVGAVRPPRSPSEAVPTFDWGYFGARSQRSLVEHQEYHGELRQTILPAGW